MLMTRHARSRRTGIAVSRRERKASASRKSGAYFSQAIPGNPDPRLRSKCLVQRRLAFQAAPGSAKTAAVLVATPKPKTSKA